MPPPSRMKGPSPAHRRSGAAMTDRPRFLGCLAAVAALAVLGGCERGSGPSPAAVPGRMPASSGVVQPEPEVAGAPPSALSATAAAEQAPTVEVDGANPAGAPHPEPEPPPVPRADGSCHSSRHCAPPATCASENALVGKEHRRGSYCTTPRDRCRPWDDQKCGARAACLYASSEKRWTCQPVTMRGLID